MSILYFLGATTDELSTAITDFLTNGPVDPAIESWIRILEVIVAVLVVALIIVAAIVISKELKNKNK